MVAGALTRRAPAFNGYHIDFYGPLSATSAEPWLHEAMRLAYRSGGVEKS